MKRLGRWVAAAGVVLFLLAGWTGVGEAKRMASPWLPTVGSPVVFHGTQAQ